MTARIAIAGAGFAGLVLARELALAGGFEITVFDERDHIAGNCHTSRDPHTGVMIHHYGPHIFHTDRAEIWDYVQQFGEFGPYVNRVRAVTARGVFSLPVNLLTINQFFGKRFTPQEAETFVATLGDPRMGEPQNFEEQALKMLGRELYENFFYGYTKKQWGVEPTELPASILKRLPVRFSYDDNYYNSPYQGIPVEGYTAIAEKMIDDPSIEVRLGERYEPSMRDDYDHVFFSGQMDGYFGYRLGRMQYRSLVFERFEADGDHQGNAVINYCEQEVPYTRIAEHKHFTPWESHDKTVLFREYSKAAEPGDVPYYPMRLASDKKLLAGYVELAEAEEHTSFIGRLGTYRYLDMHVVMRESLELAATCLATPLAEWPSFSAPPV
ncbi:MAG: putative UDP-galactopyranose mutase [Microbacteriaceae bacterium]|jgi:UDP-galactopyranose mutase|nr:putative UDP-galactopyranose mutase [Microbacteriaceae bacterium]